VPRQTDSAVPQRLRMEEPSGEAQGDLPGYFADESLIDLDCSSATTPDILRCFRFLLCRFAVGYTDRFQCRIVMPRLRLPDMCTPGEMRGWVEDNCPQLFSLLNERARRTLPPGLVGYLSGEWAETGHVLLVLADSRVERLVEACGSRVVVDTYRRELSGIGDEQQLSDLLCEMTICSAVAGVAASASVELRPGNERDSHQCDFKVVLEGSTVYGEVKRYVDPWPDRETQGRSIALSPAGSEPPGTRRPRFQDLRSKLENVPEQFPNGTNNVLFVFHRSIGESPRYVRQALFGERFWGEQVDDDAR
jgi:hypothetical protein